VFDEHDRYTEIGDLPEESRQGILLALHKPRRRLVKQKYGRAKRQRACDLDETAIDVWQIRREGITRTLVANEPEKPLSDSDVLRLRKRSNGIAEMPATKANQNIVQNAE
jgi:hypothetical protein